MNSVRNGTPGAGGAAIEVDALGAIWLSFDARGRVSDCNQAAMSVLGYQRDDLVGQAADKIVRDRPGGACELTRADGAVLGAVAVRGSNGQGRDDSTLVAIPLPSTIDPGYSARLSALGELAHHVVHELNQPLSVIRMAIGTAKRKLGRDETVDVPFLESKLDRIDSQCMRAASIAETMRVFVPRARGIEIPQEVNRAVENALSMAAPRFRKLNIVIQPTLDRECAVMGNEMHIEPALLCVLGEVHDRVAAAAGDSQPTVSVQTKVNEANVEIVVEDNAGPPSSGSPDPGAASTAALGMSLSLAGELAGEMRGRLDYGPTQAGMRYRFELPLANTAGAST